MRIEDKKKKHISVRIDRKSCVFELDGDGIKGVTKGIRGRLKTVYYKTHTTADGRPFQVGTLVLDDPERERVYFLSVSFRDRLFLPIFYPLKENGTLSGADIAVTIRKDSLPPDWLPRAEVTLYIDRKRQFFTTHGLPLDFQKNEYICNLLDEIRGKMK